MALSVSIMITDKLGDGASGGPWSSQTLSYYDKPQRWALGLQG